MALALLAPMALAACEPSWQGTAPVTRGPSSAQAQCGTGITAYAGDTIYSIARRCNVTVRELIEANNLQAPYMITPGMLMRMPGGGGEYVVQKGDTLIVVARRLKVEFQSLARVNNKTAPYTIRVGEKLRLPGSFQADIPVAQGFNGAIIIASPNAAPQPKGAKLEGLSPPRTSAVEPQPMPVPEARHAAFQPQQSLPPQAPAAMTGRGFVWPVKGEVLAEFGPMSKGQNNDGINIAAPRGTPVRAAENGVVAYVGNELKGFGNLLLIKHADGWMTAYAHNDQLMVRKGEAVKKGQQIATVGSSGNVSSPQLHFELRRGTEAVNPAEHLHGDAMSGLDFDVPHSASTSSVVGIQQQHG